MALPVPIDHPIVQPQLFDIHQPPVVPVLQNVPSTVANIVHMVAASVANEAGAKWGFNSLRTFCYNLLVNNYWRNRDFDDVVRLALDMIALEFATRRISSPEQGIVACTEHALTLYSSSLIAMYPEIRQYLPQQVLEIANQNLSALNAVKSDIANMYSGYFGQAPGYQQAPVQQQIYQQPAMQQQVRQPTGMYPQQQMSPVRVPQQSMMSQQNVFTSSTPVTGMSTADMLKQNRYQSRIEQNRVIEPERPPVIIEQPTGVSQMPTQQKYLIIENGSEMDRAQNQITFLGGVYQTDSVIRVNEYMRSSEDLEKSQAIESDLLESNTIHPTAIMEHNLDAAITTGRIKQFESQQKDANNSVFRCFAVVANPIVSIEDASSFMKSLKECGDFVCLANKMRAMAISMEAKKIEHPDQKEMTNNLIVFLNTIDITLTNLVNDFLKNNLDIDDRISSFAEDAGELKQYLDGNYGADFGYGLEAFQNEVMDTMFDGSDHDSTAIKDVVSEQLDLKEGIFVETMPVNYSLTYLFLADKELGYKIEGDKPVIIERRTAPILYSLASSLKKHKKDANFATLKNLLVTADGIRYELLQSYVDDNIFMIAKA